MSISRSRQRTSLLWSSLLWESGWDTSSCNAQQLHCYLLAWSFLLTDVFAHTNYLTRVNCSPWCKTLGRGLLLMAKMEAFRLECVLSSYESLQNAEAYPSHQFVTPDMSFLPVLQTTHPGSRYVYDFQPYTLMAKRMEIWQALFIDYEQTSSLLACRDRERQ